MNAYFRQARGRRGFTLVELLVVITIIALISVAALLSGALNAKSEYKVNEGAREFQAALVGARDVAIRANAPRGIRLLPDPVLSPAPYGNALPGILASNRFVNIEPAPDYHEGMVLAVGASASANAFGSPPFLQVVQAPFSAVARVPLPNEPTGWYFNIRQGDKIRFNDSGAYYTVAGPMQVGPAYTGASVLQNSERFVNAPLISFPDPVSGNFVSVEFLNLVNGVDDDKDGWVDEGFDGIDNDGDGIVDPGFNGVDDAGMVNGVFYPKNGIIDEPTEQLIGNEFEQEVFVGNPPSLLSPSAYTMLRRPIVSPGSREVTLPDGIVIDMTTWNAAAATPFSVIQPSKTNPLGLPVQFPERSRVPVDPYSYYVDIMLAPSGQVVQAGAGSAGIEYNSTAPTSNMPFYHFWLTERFGVSAPLWPPQSTVPFIPGLNPNYPTETYLLPMPKGTTNLTQVGANLPGTLFYTGTPLTGERRLVTLFTKSGQIVTNSIQIFDLADINRPFYDAQAGIKEPL